MGNRSAMTMTMIDGLDVAWTMQDAYDNGTRIDGVVSHYRYWDLVTTVELARARMGRPRMPAVHLRRRRTVIASDALRRLITGWDG